MTEQELQAIEERANKATNAPWLIEAGEYSGSNWLVGTITVNLGESYRDDQVYFVTTRNVHASELEGDAKTDAEFIAHAREDVPALIAEIRSLRAKLDAVPVDAFRYMVDPWRSGPTTDAGAAAWAQIDAWMQAQERA